MSPRDFLNAHACMRAPRWLCGLVFLGAALLSLPARAEVWALLIGVSGYPTLPANKRLSGPRNDVALMEAALRARGVKSIEILADGVAGSTAEPTRAGIQVALERTAARARPGDWIVFYFSGHGAQQPQPGERISRWREPDGQDEIFLPLDVGRWQAGPGAVANGLLDDQIGATLQSAVSRGVSVWAVFDTCHAGDMAKAAPVPGTTRRVLRSVEPGLLGIPASVGKMPGGARFRLAGRQPKSPTANFGRVVAFYAGQPDEPTAEEPLAPGAGGARMVGVFTWHLTRVLEQNRRAGMRFDELMADIQARYRAEARPFPNPMQEGAERLSLPF